MLDLVERALAIDHAALSALQRNDRRTFLRLVRQELPLGNRANAIASALGADVCAQRAFEEDPS
jgi:hypothetical protein